MKSIFGNEVITIAQKAALMDLVNLHDADNPTLMVPAFQYTILRQAYACLQSEIVELKKELAQSKAKEHPTSG